jgi:hypothetical protein
MAILLAVLRSEQEKWGPSDCTDEQGRFEITSIPQGEYVLVANKDGKPSDREPFGKIFYPNVSDRDRAALISIGAGDMIDNIDIGCSMWDSLVRFQARVVNRRFGFHLCCATHTKSNLLTSDFKRQKCRVKNTRPDFN